MKTNYFLVALVLVATRLLASCGSQARVGQLQAASQSAELGDDGRCRN
jgi:outer membrane murein-binding lipoprotein Lpp